MTAQEKQLFDKLAADRQENARVIEKPSMVGTKTSVIDKYSDQAHFVYELIQNADDVGAKDARFELFPDHLVFRHNGKSYFTITDVETEREDKAAGRLGDLNSITSIANSNKESEAVIGKFGVGFKAVFQYTNTPHIYTSAFSFKIERFLVPVLIHTDFSGRKAEETVFVFPFDHSEISAAEAHEDILGKLQQLVYPTLFLKNLRKITYQCGNISGEYHKVTKENRIFGNTIAERLEFRSGKSGITDRMWLFTRETDDRHKYRYSCGFFLDKNGKLMQTDYYAFCFFPTKKDTNLNFIINAPFLLTDSREGIKATDSHNIRMISLLAELAADSFTYLRDIGLETKKLIIDDNILDYLPVRKELYIPKNDKDDISLYPFYEKIKEAFTKRELLPSFIDYASAGNAYLASWTHIPELFSNEQLAQLSKNAGAKWIFTTIGYETLYKSRGDGKHQYLTDIVKLAFRFDDIKILEQITAAFIENQTEEWLYKLYEYILKNEERIKTGRIIPIFIDRKGKAVAAFDKEGNAALFLDDDDSRGYETISEKYLANPVTRKLVERLGIKPPELKDKIYTKILVKDTLNPRTDFRTFLNYYIELVESDRDVKPFLNKLFGREFILGISEDGVTDCVCAPNDLYYPTSEMKNYLQGCGEAMFVNISAYKEYLKGREMKYLEDFLKELKVHYHAVIYQWEYDYDEICEDFGTKWETSSRECHWYDYRLDEDERVLNRIADNHDMELSLLLWKQLVHAFENASWGATVLGGVYEYFFRTEGKSYYEGFGVRMLRSEKWIFTRDGEIKSPADISIQEIAYGYDLTSDAAKDVISFLHITDSHPEYEDLDDSVRKKVEAYDKLAEMGLVDLPEEDIKKVLQMLKSASKNDNPGESAGGTEEKESREREATPEEKVLHDLKTRLQKSRQEKAPAEDEDNQPQEDNDERTKTSVDYAKKIEKAKQKCEEEISLLAQMEEAKEKAKDCKTYSYGWFSALLKLEAMLNGEENASSREVSISFRKVERELGTSRTLILKHPNKNIPQVMEELVDIPLDLTFSDGQTKRLVIEVANVQSYTLRIKVKQDEALSSMEYDEIVLAEITAQNPSFLTRELQKEFARFSSEPFGFDDDYDMQQNLCSNIRFIFGPPGTGKTTYLATKTLIPMINREKRARILVLTPTNKASDVLVSRVMQVMGGDHSYENWLVRYGVTSDEEIEKSAVFHGKDMEIENYEKLVVVTTMARFPYDYFIDSTGKFNHLHGINWDYIIVDEASMVPLVQMVYMLYLKTPKMFIIAGDPFQIEPTTSIPEWKGQHIYKMINLMDFSQNAPTVPHKYEITLLTKQYRSIESIGEIFSQLTYNGVLEHDRGNEDARALNIEGFLEYENLNIIRFPVCQFESIYRAKRLRQSSYQIYIALFVYEFSVYLARVIAMQNPDETFRIGVICPYGAQAGLIDRLLAAADLPEKIELISGTIHGFQGDECDIVLTVFNPPPSISTNTEMFLNRQNIVNVAISRAKDYLFVFVPDEETENVQNLWLINKLIKLIEKDFCSKQTTKKLEELLFGDEDYLEENAFATGHQLVNVYGLPEKRYEIRSEENALDVQVYGTSDYVPLAAAEAGKFKTMEDLSNGVLGKEVIHHKFGNGVIIKLVNNNVEIEFEEGMHRFSFPSCFEKFVRMKDEELHQKILEFLSYM